METTTKPASKQPKNKIDSRLLRRVLALAIPYRWLFAVAVVLSLVVAPLGVVRPFLIQKTVDEDILNGDLEGLVQMIGLLVVVLLVESGIRYAFLYLTNHLGQSVVRDLRVRVFDHITSLRLRYFDKTPIGTSTTRTINDVETINTVFAEGAVTILADLLSIVVVTGIMLWTNWQLTLVCLTTFPFLVLATYIFKEKVQASYQIVRTQISNLNAFLQERISGMRIVQIFNAQERERKRFEAINKTYTKAQLDTILYYAIFFPFIEIVSAASLGLMVWFGAGRVIDGDVTLGVLVAFPLYLNMLFRPMRMLADKFNALQMGLIASQRVFDTLDLEAQPPRMGSLRPERLAGHILFDRVDFSYNQQDLVLKGVSFEVQPSETLAIVGSTGSGKTTIISILNRFYDIQGGRVLVDGADLEEYELKAYRQRMAIVLQDVFLFSGTVYDNITLRDPSISRETVVNAARMIGADAFIAKLPNGYDYEVMERGATLSMGQRQLISFVRALVFDPDILILDEATSSIDPETESVIQFAIETLIQKRTSLIIAHRLSTIRHADRILVLQKGQVLEIGSHDELLQNENGHYKQLYEMQFLQPAAESLN